MYTKEFEELINIFEKVIDQRANRINLYTKINDLNIDSLEWINILVKIENSFDFDFQDDYMNIEIYYTMEDLLTYIMKKEILKSTIDCI